MFTGIVQHVGTLVRAERTPEGRRLTIDLGPLAERLQPGESVAVSGACLTAAAVRQAEADFDVVSETLSKTTLGLFRAGSRVNLERALRLDAGLDGHLVQGHIDGVAVTREIRTSGGHQVSFEAAEELTGQMVPKGSVCLDGVSLTLIDVGERTFDVALIPVTLEKTTLGRLAIGTKVNVETDLIGKYVRRYLQRIGRAPSGGVTIETLKEAGFL